MYSELKIIGRDAVVTYFTQTDHKKTSQESQQNQTRFFLNTSTVHYCLS